VNAVALVVLATTD